MAKILVVGCGDIGHRVALALHWSGHRVTGLKRRQPTDHFPFPIMTADIRQSSALARLPTDFDLVLFIVSAASRQPDAYQAVFETGLNNLLLHFAQAKDSPKLLMVSSTSVYGQQGGEWVDEVSDAAATRLTSQILLKAEQRLYTESVKNCVVRFSGIYGPGRDWLLRRAAQGEEIQKHPPSYTNRIHRDDCVAVLVFLISKQLAGESLASCYLASDHDPAPLWDVMNWIASQYHYPAPVALSAPDNADQNKRCSNARLVALGYRFLYPSYRDGYNKLYL